MLVDQIDGIIGLARDSVLQNVGRNQGLTRAWCAMDLALQQLDILRDCLESADTRDPEARWKLLQKLGRLPGFVFSARWAALLPVPQLETVGKQTPRLACGHDVRWIIQRH